ncbi:MULTISPECIES: dipeptidase [Pseudomonas]|uniref:Dipeptidase n=1 Tax=Pseudomonas sp. Hg7Tf TaxID=3236988 RepID=A0AB39I6N7_9PSED|nr:MULTISPECIES: dipeptidase [Pseudomonas]KJK07886.1 peptidase M19 [Pseudomonas sp. 5]MDD1977206.1 dipeptidase [Pseudomonas putida]MDH2558177.1 dipeptidase [Pseudomonas sp. Hg5Tf]QYX48109.1 dipeptidase [Pseudomonas sp. S11A 273]
MTRPRWQNTLRYGLPVLLALGAGASWWAWGQGYRDNPGYSFAVIRQANEVQQRLLSFDGHVSVPLTLGSAHNPVDGDSLGQFDLPKLQRGGLSAAALTVFGWPPIWQGEGAPHRPTAEFVAQARAQQEASYRIISNIARDFPERAAIAYSPDDVRRLQGEGKFAIFISMLNAYPLGTDINQLDLWASRGLRMFGFNYVGNNAWADSSRPMPFFQDRADALGGLSPLGQQAVRRLNDLGVIIDVSQMSSQALRQVSALSRAPLVASHSGPRALVDIPRNLSDDEMRLIRDSGGVVMIPTYGDYLRPISQATRERLDQLRQRFDLPALPNQAWALMPGDPVIASWPEQRFGEYAKALYAILADEPKATLQDFGNAIDHAVKTIGIDHVGISSDFNDGGGLKGFEDVSQVRNVTAELLSRGYAEADISKLWGANFLRAWAQVQQSSKPLSAR